MMFAECGRLTRLCKISHSACDALQPFVSACYSVVNSETAKLKSDSSFFTIADGTVQYLLTTHLFRSKFAAAVGEEDSKVNILNKPYMVDDLVIPETVHHLIDTARERLDELSAALEEYEDLTVFIDPIDGTREFSTGLGEQCSICIGFAASTRPVAGIVYRPLTSPPTFSMGAHSEGFVEDRLDTVASPVNGLLTSNGKISPFIEQLITGMGYVRVPSGGAGNKMLMLLEGKGSAYIQDRGVSRWDTCAAQAALEAHGGVLVKLTSFIDRRAFDSYAYVSGRDVNADPNPEAKLTAYNAKDKAAGKKGGAANAEDFALYSNLCGLLALREGYDEEMVHSALNKAKELHGLSYD